MTLSLESQGGGYFQLHRTTTYPDTDRPDCHDFWNLTPTEVVELWWVLAAALK